MSIQARHTDGGRFVSEQLTVEKMLRGRERRNKRRKSRVKTTRQLARAMTTSTSGLGVRGFAWRKQGSASGFTGATLLGWNQKRRHGEVESEAVATPIIKGTLVIESEETD